MKRALIILPFDSWRKYQQFQTNVSIKMSAQFSFWHHQRKSDKKCSAFISRLWACLHIAPKSIECWHFVLFIKTEHNTSREIRWKKSVYCHPYVWNQHFVDEFRLSSTLSINVWDFTIPNWYQREIANERNWLAPVCLQIQQQTSSNGLNGNLVEWIAKICL